LIRAGCRQLFVAGPYTHRQRSCHRLAAGLQRNLVAMNAAPAVGLHLGRQAAQRHGPQQLHGNAGQAKIRFRLLVLGQVDRQGRRRAAVLGLVVPGAAGDFLGDEIVAVFPIQSGV
jgi:hypothetical protein